MINRSEIHEIAKMLISNLLAEQYTNYYYFDNEWLHIVLRRSRANPRRALLNVENPPKDIDIIQISLKEDYQKKGIGTELIEQLAIEGYNQKNYSLFIEQAITPDSQGLLKKFIRENKGVYYNDQYNMLYKFPPV